MRNLCKSKCSLCKTIIIFSFLQASATNTGRLRLVGGINYREGRLEVFHNFTWGTVCDDEFVHGSAIVACKELGFSPISGVQFYTAKGGTGTIWLDNVVCSGSEGSISDCAHNPWGSHNCGHGEDVGIRCIGNAEGEIRLAGLDNDNNAGRLEIFHNGQWGTVCNDEFGTNDARVVCRQLGKSTLDARYYTAGNGSGQIWLDDVACTGYEASLTACNHPNWGVENCGHSEDVGVRCNSGSSDTTGNIRLVGDTNLNYGRLEIYYGSWGTICDDSFDINDGIVACRQLGFRYPNVHVYTDGKGTGSILLDNMECTGNENRLTDCSNSGWNTHDCSHGEDVGIMCFGDYGITGNWGMWSSWNRCDASCGTGSQSRTRNCDSPVPSFRGSNCSGLAFETRSCNTVGCPVDGSWAAWNTWEQCSVTCGQGYHKRFRSCTNPLPSLGGRYCTGTSFEIQECKIQNCAVNGNWGTWSNWQPCDVSCGTGRETRIRNCESPAPSFGGNTCSGNAYETQSCNTIGCAVDGNWATWNLWEPCSATCGPGYQKRLRYCTNPSPYFGGSYCEGSSFEIQECNILNCPVNGNWTDWTAWGNCNVSCGEGQQQRSRYCYNPAPTKGGSDCKGDAIEIQLCVNDPCPDSTQAFLRKYSTMLISGVGAGCVVFTIVILFMARCLCKRITLARKGTSEMPSGYQHQMNRIFKERSSPNDYTKTRNTEQNHASEMFVDVRNQSVRFKNTCGAEGGPEDLHDALESQIYDEIQCTEYINDVFVANTTNREELYANLKV